MFELKTLESYSDQALIDEIKRVAALLKGQRLTQERFLAASRVHVTTIRNRFGSWKRALDLADIDEASAPRFAPITRKAVINAIKAHAQEFPDSSPKVEDIAARLGVHKTTLAGKFGAWQGLLREVGLKPVALGRRYTDEECFENIVALWTYYGRQPNFAELNQAPSTVGSKAYIRRWGGWRSALGAFIRHVDLPSPRVTILVASIEPKNPGARTRKGRGSIRTDIQGSDGGEAAAPGERIGRRSGARDRRERTDAGALAQ